MALAERAELVARLSLKDDLSGAGRRAASNFSSSLGKMRSAASRTGKAIGVGLGAGLAVGATLTVRAINSGLDSLAELEDATTSVDGAIKQLGYTGKVTSQEIAGWANEIEAATQAAFDDKAITQAATTLLRYGKVAPKDLKTTLTVMTDLAAKTGSVESAASKLAKSLADPTKATRVLREVGVTLTKAQQDQIKKWVASGKLGKAQALILQEVAKQTKGAAAAMNGPYRDSQLVFQDVMEDSKRALATGFLPVLEEIRKELSDELAKPSTLARIREFGEGLAGGVKGLVSAVKQVDWDAVGGSLKLAGQGARAVYDAFMGMPDWVKTAVLTGWGLNKLSGGALGSLLGSGIEVGLKGVFGQFFARGASPANPMYVVPVGGLPGSGPPVGPTPTGGGSLLANTVGTVGAAATVAGGLLAIQDIQSGTEEGVKRGLLTAAGGFPAMIGRAVGEAIGDPLGDLLHTQKTTATDISIADRAQQQKLNALKEKLEANRIAAVTSKTAIVSGAHSDRNAIVSAIRAIQRPIVNIGVTSTLVRVTYATGGTLSRYSGKLIPES